MRGGSRRGSVLALVVVVSGILFLLVGIAFIYFQANARSSIFKMERTRASTAAEAGVALAVHYLSSLNEFHHDGVPFVFRMEEDSAGWHDIPHCGKVFVVIDPSGRNWNQIDNRRFQIRARGISGSTIMDIQVNATPAFPSSFALLTDLGIPEGFFIDGRIVEGPVHSNGPVVFSSNSPDSTGDPYVSMISTTSEGGFIVPGYGAIMEPHPVGSNLWIRPYTRHRQGTPYWDPYSRGIDFQRMTNWFNDLFSGPLPPDGALINAERLIIERERIAYREGENSPERSLYLDGISLVLVRNGFSPVLVKSVGIPRNPVTIVTLGDMHLAGYIDGGSVGSGGPTGLVSLGNIVIPVDPDITGGPDWSGRWQIETESAFMVRACLAAPGGSLTAQRPYLPREMTRITIAGSLTEKSMGRLSSGISGYQLGIAWDQGLSAKRPPYFPALGRLQINSWNTSPEYNDDEIEDDLF